MSITLAKRSDGAFVPVDQMGADLARSIGPGEGVEVVIPINVKLHRKLMVLLRFAFDQWRGPEETHAGEQVEKNFKRFRQDIAILSGHFDRVFDEGGTTYRLVARSLSFDTIRDHEELAEIYESVVAVILRRVLTSYKREDVDLVVDEIIRGFA